MLALPLPFYELLHGNALTATWTPHGNAIAVLGVAMTLPWITMGCCGNARAIHDRP